MLKYNKKADQLIKIFLILSHKLINIQHMKKRASGQQQQLQISSFIKEPASLKLLILAGTNIKPVQLTTIAKCIGLIKLDLSSNFLAQLPLKFSTFSNMKILYLHDNQLTQVDIKNTQLEYISLFKNPMQPQVYRKQLISSNQQLAGIDFNIVTMRQKYMQNYGKLPIYSEIKWPIVEISSNLEHEDDYLNLLKAEIFVVANVQRRTRKIQIIQYAMHSFLSAKKYKELKLKNPTPNFYSSKIYEVARKWKQFTLLKRKLRLILKNKNKEYLIHNKIQLKKYQRSLGLSDVLSSYFSVVRLKMKVREPFERQMRALRYYIPTQKILFENFLNINEHRDYKKEPYKLYFKYSELDMLSKVCLYAKKLFFKQKLYDLCDQFNNLFQETNKKYYIFRTSSYNFNQKSFLLNSIHETSKTVLRQIGVNRLSLLYSKKGHKHIKVKSINKAVKLSEQQKQKRKRIDKKLHYLFENYDKLIEYEVKDYKILRTVLKIIRYINAGNAESILSTETAYFQTEVIFDDKQEKKVQKKIHLGFQFFTQRVIAANHIQRFWRKYSSNKKGLKTIEHIRQGRAEKLISRWLRNLIFYHRMSSLKFQSYYKSLRKENQFYFHLDVYMKMPRPMNNLRLQNALIDPTCFYDIIHKKSTVDLIQIYGRRWLKVTYNSAKEAVDAQILFHRFTYCYAFGFYIQLFSQNQIRNQKQLKKYQSNVKNFYKIDIQTQSKTKQNIKIDNLEPFFIWSEVDSLKHFKTFQKHERNNTNVNIFIYNKNRRPLKVSCQFYWTMMPTLYENSINVVRKKKSIISVNENSKKTSEKKDFAKQADDRLSFFQLEYGIKGALKSKRHLMDFPRKKQLQRSIGSIKKKLSADSRNESPSSRSHRSRVVSGTKLQKLSETLNIRSK